MIIFWVNPSKEPSNGDIKILKNGDIFIRTQRTVDGCYVVSNGKPCFDWYSESNSLVKKYKSGASAIDTYYYHDGVSMKRFYINEEIRHVAISTMIEMARLN